jgi:hypothetical protein
MENMATQEQPQRGTWWPLLIAFLGVFGLLDYFYKSNFSIHDLLRGVGFLLMLPEAYLHPANFALGKRQAKLRQSTATTWLALFGVALAVAGVLLEWV